MSYTWHCTCIPSCVCACVIFFFLCPAFVISVEISELAIDVGITLMMPDYESFEREDLTKSCNLVI